MPRTVPTVDGTGQLQKVSVKYISANGQRRTDTMHIDQAATAAQIEAIIAALAAGSNASIYAVNVQQIYSSNPDIANALDAPRESTKDNVVYFYKNPVTQDTRDFFLPAPVDAMFQVGSNSLNTANALLIAVRTALNAVLNNYDLLTVRFSERRKKNPAQPIASS